MDKLISENPTVLADIFSIVGKNLSIVDKVELGLTCKTMHNIMKPIIKKDNVKVIRCMCKCTFPYRAKPEKKGDEIKRESNFEINKCGCYHFNGHVNDIEKEYENNKKLNVVMIGCIPNKLKDLQFENVVNIISHVVYNDN